MNILISGAGIAGPTLAYWLAQFGFVPTIVERSPRLRTGGYVIDFWGLGFDVAERMGLASAIRRDGYVVQRLDIVDRHGRRVASVPTAGLTASFSTRFTSVPRGALAADIFHAVEDNVELIFGDTVTHLQEERDGVTAIFGRHGRRRLIW